MQDVMSMTYQRLNTHCASTGQSSMVHRGDRIIVNVNFIVLTVVFFLLLRFFTLVCDCGHWTSLDALDIVKQLILVGTWLNIQNIF